MTTESKSYEIQGWDPVLGEPEQPLAMVYIKPDLELLQLFNNAPMKNTLVRVSGSGSGAYDDKIVWGTIDKSSDVPNCRQNIFNCNGLYAITLDIIWLGYPLENGFITFVDGVIDKLESLKTPSSSLQSLLPPVLNSTGLSQKQQNKYLTEKQSDSNEENKGFNKVFLNILVSILLFILLSCIIYKYK